MREFLQLAQKYSPKICIAGWYMSEKLDGMRCFWDGGITRGQPKSQVFWANTDKDDRLLNQEIATGLWSRYGNVIHAPDWWLNKLPIVPLDGELWLGRKRFNDLVSITKTLDDQKRDWEDVCYYVFDTPSYRQVFGDGTINNPNYKKEIRYSDFEHHYPEVTMPMRNFERTYEYIQKTIPARCTTLKILEQHRLSFSTKEAEAELETFAKAILDGGGEGVMVRKPEAFWTPCRSNNILKYKPYIDDEAKVIGCTTGEGKLRGKFGSLKVVWKDVMFDLSGFTNEERKLSDESWAANNPGISCPKEIYPIYFPYGTIVTFKYREVTPAGIPREASYLRRWEIV